MKFKFSKDLLVLTQEENAGGVWNWNIKTIAFQNKRPNSLKKNSNLIRFVVIKRQTILLKIYTEIQ